MANTTDQLHIAASSSRLELDRTEIGSESQPSRLRMILRLLIIAFAALQLWAAVLSQSMNEDGINYLDIADAYMDQDWQAAINSTWSPMYSWILGPILHILKPSMRWEFPLVHIVNFIIFLGTMVCFEFFWQHVQKFKKAVIAGSSAESLPNWAWITLGYILFAIASLYYIGIWTVTPDLLMSAFVYLAAGLVLRIRLGDSRLRTFILLGSVLGLSYLTKTIMFPVSIVILTITLFTAGGVRQALPRVALSGLAFLLFILPFVSAISILNGEVTFGEAGTLTYARYLNGVPYPHWQGETPGNGSPVHSSRQILEIPPIYEFGKPISGTYPISYDHAYWYEGIEVHFDLRRQLDYLSFSTLFYLDLFFRQLAGLALGVLLLYLMSRWQPLRPSDYIARWGLSIVALFAFLSYALVSVLERYVGVFVVLFWADLLANISMPISRFSKKLTGSLSAVVIMLLLASIISFNLELLRDFVGWGNPHQFSVSSSRTPSWPGEVAESLQTLGIEPGNDVAVIGYAISSFWARLARVHIVAELLSQDADTFYLGDDRLQSEVIQTFAGTGAAAIVAENVPDHANLDDWNQVGRTNYYIYLLRPQP